MHFRQAGFSTKAAVVLAASVGFLAGPVQAAPPTGAAPATPRQGPAKWWSRQPPAAIPPAPIATPKPQRKRPVTRPAGGEAIAPGASGIVPPETAPAPKAPAGKEPAPAAKAGPEYADAWPSEFRPAPVDLQLKPEDARKAEALAAFTKGLLAEDQADPEGMLAGYRRALELDPTHAELAVKVAYELARRNDVAAGIQVLKDTIKASPKEPLPYIYLSQLYTNQLKKPDLGLTYAEQALLLAPGNFKAYLALHEIYEGTAQPKKSEAVLEKAFKSDSKDPQFWVDLGEFFQKLYLKPDGACTPEQLARMNAVYEKVAALAPDKPALLSKVADFYVLSKQIKEAIPYYLSVLRLAAGPNDPAAANVREKLARSLIVTGQRDEAIETFEQLVRDYPQRFETREVLGELYRQAGNHEKAAENFRFGLPLDVDEPRNHLRLADLLSEAKKYDEAIATLNSARKKFPDLPYITYGIALAQGQAERHTDALATFAEAQKEAEEHSEEMLGYQFFFHYGAAAEQAGQFERAAELLKRSIELEPTVPIAYNYLGYMWADRGENLEEAGKLIKKAVEMEPENGAYLDSLGWYFYKTGDAESALKELLHAQQSIVREMNKEDPTVLDHIADAYAKLGKIPEALGYWQKALAVEQEDLKLRARITEKLEAAKQKVTSGSPVPEPAQN